MVADGGELYRMSQKDDLISRLKTKPKDFTISELDSIMSKCHCQKNNRGRTSGSGISYVHETSGKILKIHSPHPQKELKRYMIEMVIDFLEEISEI